MDLAAAALVFAEKLMDKTWPKQWGAYDHQTMSEVVKGIVKVTQDHQMIETLIRTARYESGAWRKEFVYCKVKVGYAFGAFGIAPLERGDRAAVCSPDISVQAKLAEKRVKISIETCKKLGYKDSDLLTAYTHGTCRKASDNIAKTHWGDGTHIQPIIDWFDTERTLVTNAL